jgi:hypothetical protein
LDEQKFASFLAPDVYLKIEANTFETPECGVELEARGKENVLKVFHDHHFHCVTYLNPDLLSFRKIDAVSVRAEFETIETKVVDENCRTGRYTGTFYVEMDTNYHFITSIYIQNTRQALLV